MTDTNQQPAHSTDGRPAMTRRAPVAGIDVVPGDPPVPLSVWYRANPGDGRRDLARQIIDSYSNPGQVVLDFDADTHLRTAAAVAGRVYLSLPRIRILVDLAAVGVDLIVVRWPRPKRDSRAASSTAEHDLALALRSLLGAYGHAVIAFDPPPPGVLHAAQAAPLIDAATNVGLGHRQNVIHLDTGLRGDVLDTTGLPPDTAGPAAGVAAPGPPPSARPVPAGRPPCLNTPSPSTPCLGTASVLSAGGTAL